MTSQGTLTPGAAVFDLGGVVFRYLPERRFEAFAAASGRDANDLRKVFMDSGYSRSCDAGRRSGDDAYREGVRLLGRRTSFDRFREHWIAAFEPDLAVVDLVRRLHAHVPVAMLTNNSAMVRQGLERRHPEVMELFRPRVFSADTGLLKPDPRLYRTLMELLGLAPQQILYVDAEATCVGVAASLGMESWQFHSADALEHSLVQRGLLP